MKIRHYITWALSIASVHYLVTAIAALFVIGIYSSLAPFLLAAGIAPDDLANRDRGTALALYIFRVLRFPSNQLPVVASFPFSISLIWGAGIATLLVCIDQIKKMNMGKPKRTHSIADFAGSE